MVPCRRRAPLEYSEGISPQEVHQWPGVLDACEVPECSHGGNGPSELDATQGLQGVDHRGHTPGLHVSLEVLCETLEAIGVCVDGSDLFLNDDWLRWCGACDGSVRMS
jgi:hypothetical protein